MTDEDILKCLELGIQGKKLYVLHSDEALETLKEALIHVIKSKRSSYLRFIYVTINAIANGERLSKGSLVAEDEMPDGKRYFAIKKIPIRGYCFYCSSQNTPNNSILYIGFYVFKDYQKLQKSTTNRMIRHYEYYTKRQKI